MTKLKLQINKLSLNEKNDMGVFISYSRKSDAELCNNLMKLLNENGINILHDSKIDLGSEDFNIEIKKMLAKSSVAVIILPSDGNYTQWITYEIALLESIGKNIYLYQKDDKKSSIPSFLRKYLPIIHNEQKLIELLKTNFLFKDLLSQSTSLLTIEDYNDYIKEHIEYFTLNINLPNLIKVKRDSFSFGVIICSLFKIEASIERNTDICGMNGSELVDSICYPQEKLTACPLLNVQTEIFFDRVVFNKIYFTDKITDHDEVVYILPISKKCGITFKCFVDIYDLMMKEQIVEVLNNAGITDISDSSSGNGNRIYFCLPKVPYKGLFTVQQIEGFFNNYICPGIL